MTEKSATDYFHTGHNISRNILRAATLAIFLFFFALYSLTMQGVPSGGDSWGMFLATESIVNDGDAMLDNSDRVVLVPCRDGNFCSRFAVGQSLVQIPAYSVGKLFLRGAAPETERDILYFATSFTNPAIVAATASVLFLFCIALGYSGGTAFFLTALFGLGTLAWPASKTLLSEPLQMLCLTASTYLLYTIPGSRRAAVRTAAAGGFAGLLILTKPFCGIALPLLFIYLISKIVSTGIPQKKQIAAAAAFIAPVAVCGFLALYWNWLRFGDYSEFGYYLLNDRDSLYRFSTPLLAGLHGLLFSSGKGVFFYVPATAASFAAAGVFWRRNRAEALLFATLFAAFVLAYAKWNQWHGDFAWGPRFLTLLMPFIILPLGAAIETMRGKRLLCSTIFLLLLDLSIFVQILGVAPRTSVYLTMAKQQPPFQTLHKPGDLRLRDDLINQHFVPEFSPLAAHWWGLKHTLDNSRGEQLRIKMLEDFPWKSLVRDGAPLDPSWFAGLDFWPYYFDAFFPNSGRLKSGLISTGFSVLAASFLVILLVICKMRKSKSGHPSLKGTSA